MDGTPTAEGGFRLIPQTKDTSLTKSLPTHIQAACTKAIETTFGSIYAKKTKINRSDKSETFIQCRQTMGVWALEAGSMALPNNAPTQ